MGGQGLWTVTPEAVVLELPTATLGTRVPARLLDLLIESVGAGAILLAVTLSNLSGAAGLVVPAVLSFAVLFVYPVVMETFAGGRTVGKMVVGLRVVSTEGAPITFRQAVIRAVLSPVDIVLGAVTMLLSSRDQRLGDLAAVVVRYRTAANTAGMAWFPVPPGLEPFAAALDVSGLADADYEVLRSYLLRWPELTPQPRFALGVALARDVARRLGHVLPQWIGPDQYLACVAACYQTRRGPSVAPPGWGPPHPGAPGAPPLGPNPIGPAPPDSAPPNAPRWPDGGSWRLPQ